MHSVVRKIRLICCGRLVESVYNTVVVPICRLVLVFTSLAITRAVGHPIN